MTRELRSVVVMSVVVLGAGCGGQDLGADPLTPAGSLTSSEASALVLMREEEKLARDVYQALAERWGFQVFSNIATSEQTHMDAVAGLLTAYGLADPSAGKARGAFADVRMQELHDQLLATGSGSLEQALVVGATIEDLDLADLARLSGETTRTDLLAVWATLERGSRNHLRAFHGQLTSRGLTYAPQFIDAQTYAAIVSTPQERGGP